MLFVFVWDWVSTMTRMNVFALVINRGLSKRIFLFFWELSRIFPTLLLERFAFDE